MSNKINLATVTAALYIYKHISNIIMSRSLIIKRIFEFLIKKWQIKQ